MFDENFASKFNRYYHPDPLKHFERISLKNIVDELNNYEGEFVLLDRKRKIVENYSESGSEYPNNSENNKGDRPPTNTYYEYTREAGILIPPGLISYRSLGTDIKSQQNFLERVVAEITVEPKFRLDAPLLGNIHSANRIYKKEPGNIKVYEEDLDESVKRAEGKLGQPASLSTETLWIVVGNNKVLNFLETHNDYSEMLGRSLFECMKFDAK